VENPFSEFPPDRVEKLNRYHRNNPGVYEEFVRTALKLKALGHKTYSAQHIVYYLRGQRDLVVKGGGYKISNYFTKMFAKAAACEYPELRGFFRHVSSKEAA